jgi:hypothetical protein
MKPIVLVAFALVLSTGALAQSKEDRKAALTGVTSIAIHETGVGALGGGTAGSPYLLQAEKSFKAAGLHVGELEKAMAAGTPIYNVHCSAMEAGDQVRVACESRFIRQVFLEAKENAKNIYAVAWTSPLYIASVPRDALSDVEKLTQQLVDNFVKDWSDANPGVKPAAAAKPKKK